MCFFGFFRAGELTVPNPTSFNPTAHLTWGDVSISEDGRMLRVFLKRSKTDQYGRGTEVSIGTTGDLLCPVDAVRTYAARRGSAEGAFFCTAEGVPLSKTGTVGSGTSGVSTSGYSGHSFRIFGCG
jgi:hypothetical protein